MFRIGSIVVVVALCAGIWLIMRSIIVRTSAPAPHGLAFAASSSLSNGGESAVSVPSEVVNPNALKGAAFVGNSCVDALDNYGIIREATFFARTGLTVKEAFEKPIINGKVPVLDELKQGQTYPKVFLLFGENELGWSTDSVFVEWYTKVIQSVHASQPKAKVYVQSIFPVSKAVSDRNKNNTNNTRINQFNEMLKQICKEQNATYVDVHSQFVKPDGSLIDGISTDGIHFNKDGCQKWADYLRAYC